jgi:hypothetical protein
MQTSRTFLWQYLPVAACLAMLSPGPLSAQAAAGSPVDGKPSAGGLTWTFVDGPTGLNSNPEFDTYYPQLTVYQGKLYAAWREMSPSDNLLNTKMQIRVAVYNGDDAKPAWAFVDGGGESGINWNIETDAFDVQLTVFEDRLYAIWQEKSKGADQIRVAVYNGDDAKPAWTFVDGGGETGINHDTTQGTGYPQLTVFNEKLYATWYESYRNKEQIRVAVYNGNDKTPAWTSVDGNGPNGLNQNPANNAYHPQLTVFGSKLYLTWEEKIRYTGHIHVMVYNGNDAAPQWKFIDGGGEAGINYDPSKDASYPQLTAHDDKLYATWTELDGGAKQVRVAVYNGNDQQPAWTFVDGNGPQGINRNGKEWAYTPQLTVFRSQLYATWYESTGNVQGPSQTRLALYNGNDRAPAWTFADGGGATGINRDPRYAAFDPQLTVFQSKLYGTWKEKRGKPRGHRVRVVVGQ